MSGGFNNPLVGGGGSLVYPSIHSPNFVAGSTGWSIDKDGSAEFDNVTIRGILEAIVGGSLVFQTDQFGDFIWYNSHGAQAIAIVPAKQAIFIYADTGSSTQGALVLSIAPVGGTDGFGNTYQAGMTSYLGSGLSGVLNNASLALTKASGANAPPTVQVVDNVAGIQTVINAADIVTALVIAVQPGTQGTAEIWHALTPITSFTGTCRYRKTAENCVRIQINGTFSATGTVSLGTLPSGYIPSGNNGTSPYAQPLSESTGTFNNLRWDISSAGAINVRGIPATGVTISGMSDWALN